MEVKELMLKDWCIIAGWDHPTRIVQCQMMQLCMPLGLKVSPVPLTEEILKANGFDVDGHHSMFYINKGTPDEVSIHINFADFFDINTPNYKFSGICRYVHELQHALRMCDLNDLADHFKLE